MCTIVTSSDMTSFIYIGDEEHHLSKWLGKEKKWPPAKMKLSYLYWVIEECKDELQRMLDKPGNSHAVSSRNDFIAGLDWKHTTKLQENEHMCKPHFAAWETKQIAAKCGSRGEGPGGPDPPGKSQVIWVSIGSKQLPPPPPPWKNFDPLRNLEKWYFSLKLTIWFL